MVMNRQPLKKSRWAHHHLSLGGSSITRNLSVVLTIEDPCIISGSAFRTTTARQSAFHLGSHGVDWHQIAVWDPWL